LAQRLAERRQTLGLSAPTGKAEQIRNANAIRSAGNQTGKSYGEKMRQYQGGYHAENAGAVNKALVDSRAGHSAHLSFNQGQGGLMGANVASTAPVHAAPESLGTRILNRLKSQAGSAAAHLRGKATSFIRSPLGKATAVGAGVVGAGALAHKAFGNKDSGGEEYYSQGYGGYGQ
jgi:hypothetical protein